LKEERGLEGRVGGEGQGKRVDGRVGREVSEVLVCGEGEGREGGAKRKRRRKGNKSNYTEK
jgi:hypothetical protein